LAAFSSNQSRACAKCGATINPGELKCEQCGRYTYADELKEMAVRARQLTAIGHLAEAKQLWETALRMLPPGSNEFRAVQTEIAQLERRLHPQSQQGWAKRLGPLGAIVAFLAKFKGLLFVLAKFKTLLSLFAFFGVYWLLFGWWFAVGLCGSIFIHEMGHYVVVRRFGFAANLPMFIPGFGAYVSWNGANVDAGTRAQISLAGPLFGFLSGLAAYGLFEVTGRPVWMAVAQFAGYLNLLNLIPVWILDGASAMNALGKQERLAVLVVSLALFALVHYPLFVFVAIGTGYRLWRADYPAEPRRRIGIYFVALVIVNGMLAWWAQQFLQSTINAR
jgi:Zn-dependent protease/RNA polymerase subunit RPABC4/transcription elongation factor Spt4